MHHASWITGATFFEIAIYNSASCLGSLLRGTRYAVSDIYNRGRYLSSWLRGTRYAVSDICKKRSVVRSALVSAHGLKNEVYY